MKLQEKEEAVCSKVTLIPALIPKLSQKQLKKGKVIYYKPFLNKQYKMSCTKFKVFFKDLSSLTVLTRDSQFLGQSQGKCRLMEYTFLEYFHFCLLPCNIDFLVLIL